MEVYIKIPLIILINYLIFTYAGFWFGILALAISVYKILALFGFIRNPIVYRASFLEGIAFTKDYIGPYDKLDAVFQEINQIKNKFKLKDFVPIAIYYDKDKTIEPNKRKSSIGLYKKKKGNEISEEFNNYCIKNGFNKNELPNAVSLFSSWEYSSNYTMKMGIEKFNKIMEHNLKNENFLKTFRVNEKDIKVLIEVYENSSLINFYIPFKKVDEFLIFKKDK